MKYYARVISKTGILLYKAEGYDFNALELEMNKVLVWHPDAKREVSDKPFK